MKFDRMVKQVSEVATLRCDMEPRYWEDAAVGGVNCDDEDDQAPKMPLRKGDIWQIDIDLATGKIANWPVGISATTHFKVCDAGVYSLLDAEGAVATTKDGYVPDMLAPSGGGYGDYVILDIGADGVIAGWRADLSYFGEAQ